MIGIVAVLSVWVSRCLGQNVDYTMSCTTHTSETFTITIDNTGSSRSHTIALDCSGSSETLALPRNGKIDYPMVLSTKKRTKSDEDACIIADSHVKKDFLVFVINVIGEDFTDMAIHMVYCDTRPNEDNRYSFARTSCQENAKGVVDVQVENPYDTPMDYNSFWCGRAGEFNGTVPPRTTITLPTIFVKERDNPPKDICYFSPDAFPSPLMLYFSFDAWASDRIEQVLNCYVGRPPKGATPPALPEVPAGPILQLLPNCPTLVSEPPRPKLRADVPAYALAKCRNGDKEFVPSDYVSFVLGATLDQNYVGRDCQFYKKVDSNTYTLDVEVGWGEDSHLITHQRVQTISCVYDEFGKGVSTSENVGEWFIAPPELQTLIGSKSPASFKLKILDVMDHEIDVNRISIGKKIRLEAIDSSGTAPAFHALSCLATNGVSSYAILRAGCGDGVVLKKSDGFITDGKHVYSPYFEAFKLIGGKAIEFHCSFTVCRSGSCNGSSCPTVTRRRRSGRLIHKKSFLLEIRPPGSSMVVTSLVVFLAQK